MRTAPPRRSESHLERSLGGSRVNWIRRVVQLRKTGKAYGRPLAVLLLAHPPNERGFDALRDFRRADTRPSEPSPELLREVRRAVAQREVLLDLYEISPASTAAPSSLPDLGASRDPDTSGERLRSFIGVELAEQRRAARARSELSLWIDAIEAKAILVMQTRGVDSAEMQGFSLSDWPFPVIALNGSDQPRRRLFTLLHELAHLALNLGGLCDLQESQQRSSARVAADREIEHRCNAIAASVLLPRRALLQDVAERRDAVANQWPLADLATLSAKYGVSSEAVLLRLVDLGEASWDLYWSRKPQLDLAYQAVRDRERQRNRESDGGPSYYVVKARDIGHGYAASVLDAYRGDRISSLDVADYLGGIRFSQLSSFEAVVR